VRALLQPVLSPTLTQLRRFALAGVVADTVIMSTGAAVRLSSSGLGCPDWPRCSHADIVASHNAGQTLVNTWIEFGNRLLNFPLVAIAALIFIAAWRYQPRSKSLIWLAAIQPLGVIAQAVIGGIVVLTKLNPVSVSIHFLVSVSIVGFAVLLYFRCGEPEAAPGRRDLRLLAGALTLVTCAMLAAGTVVTGTGPLAGHADTPRYHLPLEGVTQFHADIGWLLGGLVAALVLGLRFSGASPRVMRTAWWLIGMLVVQGALGYVQYFNHLPAGLVWVHVSTSVVVWILVLWLFLLLQGGERPVHESAAAPQREIELSDR
jgi:heme a synthase